MPSNSVLGRIERFAHVHGGRAGQVVMALILLYLWIPMAILVLMSFAGGGVLSFPPEELTLKWYSRFMNNQEAIGAIVTSLKISLPVTVVSIMLATMVAYAADRYQFPGKDYIQVLVTLPLIVPLVVGGVALILFFGIINFELGYGSVFVAHLVRTIPFTTLIIISAFFSFDRTLEEASKDLGADELQTFWQVTIPNVLPGIIAGGLLAFTISFNEFVYTFFVKTSATTTLPIYIWGKIRYGVTPEVNVISVVFILVAVVTIMFAVWLTRVERVAGRGG